MPLKARLFKLIRRSLVISGSALGVVALLGLLGITLVWGYYWDFRIGNVSTDTCSNCHTMESYIAGLRSSEYLGEYHATRGITCIDCHPQSLKSQFRESAAQILGNFDTPLVRLKYPKADCLQCHEHSSYQEITWRTTDLGISDEKAGGTEANPHQPPHYEALECNSCHRVHQSSTLFCWECHTYEFDPP